MQQELFNQEYLNLQYWFLGFQIITGLAAVMFAFLQYKINKRLQRLQDYVAVTIVPIANPLLPRLQIVNVGKINVYLHKYEIGSNKEAYAKAMLIPAGSGSFLLLPIKSSVLGQNMDIKLYLVDELGEKYISTGEAILEKQIIATQKPDGTTENITAIEPSAWSYKTIKKDWEF
ncbi:MAG: hypothetical protein PHR47_01090 [Candidatus Pacebacteria bacterium]|nr:hypothetical protein [Candidatus Paceibacterota bacterium]